MTPTTSAMVAGSPEPPVRTKVAALEGHRYRRAWLWVGVAVLVLLAIRHIPFPALMDLGGNRIMMDAQARTTLAILMAAVVLWVSEAIPYPVTALMVFVLLGAFHVHTGTDPKVTPFEEAVRNGLGRPVIAFIIGVLVLSTAFVRSGLGERSVDCVLERVGNNPDRLLLATLYIGMLLAAFVTALAAVATIFPLTMSILRRARARPQESNFGRALMLATCMGPLIGGMAAPTGSAPNVVALDYLLKEHIAVRFVDWMAIGFPSAIILTAVAWLVLRTLYPLEKHALDKIEIPDEGRSALSAREWAVIAIMFAAIATWILGPFIGEKSKASFWQQPQWVGLMAGCLCFVPGLNILSWHEAERGVPWRVVLIIGAGLAVGVAFYESGAAQYVAWALFRKVVEMPDSLRFFGLVLAVAMLHMILSSNLVTGAVAIPLMIAIAKMFGISPWLLCAPAALTAPLAIILPTESPDALIAYSSGYFSVKDMAKAGVLITLAAVIVIGVVLNIVVPHQTALLQAPR